MNSQTLMMTPGTRTVAAEPSRKLLVICKQVTMRARCVSICNRAGTSVCVCVCVCPAWSAVRLISPAAAHSDDFICRDIAGPLSYILSISSIINVEQSFEAQDVGFYVEIDKRANIRSLEIITVGPSDRVTGPGPCCGQFTLYAL